MRPITISGKAFGVLNSSNLQVLEGSDLVIYGSGETGREFLSLLFKRRLTLNSVVFLDSFYSGQIHINGNLFEVKQISQFCATQKDKIVIASVDFLEIIENTCPTGTTEQFILGNEVINAASHLSNLQSFYLSSEETKRIQKLLVDMNEFFPNQNDVELLSALIELRSGESEEFFYKSSIERLRQDKLI